MYIRIGMNIPSGKSIQNIIAGWCFSFLLLTPAILPGQQDSLPKGLALSGFLETYYAWENKSISTNGSWPSHLVSHYRNQEFALNLALLQAAWNKPGLRARFGIMAGNYPMANLAGEPVGLRNLYEASVALRLSPRRHWWAEVGLFPSHIGFETPIGADNLNLSRSIVADNSPYYEQGVKLTWQNPDKKWVLSLLALNGWQKMVKDNPQPALEGGGHQVTYAPGKGWLINSSSYVGLAPRPVSGNSTATWAREERVYHNLYVQWHGSGRWQLISGVDYGIHRITGTGWRSFYAPVVISRYAFRENMRVAVRAEGYHDPSQIVWVNPSGTRIVSFSANWDYEYQRGILFRLEYRPFLYAQSHYRPESILTRNRLTFSFCCRL
ncbi:MAG: porin [Bacteroidia bacterium]|nr:porin [Bacteroidia bacterium]